MSKDHVFIPHSDVELLGFAITDATIESGEKIWVGAGIEGRWLTSAEVRELTAALVKVANAHDARLATDATQNTYRGPVGGPACPDCGAAHTPGQNTLCHN